MAFDLKKKRKQNEIIAIIRELLETNDLFMSISTNRV